MQNYQRYQSLSFLIKHIYKNPIAQQLKIYQVTKRLKTLKGQKNQFKINSLISIKINSAGNIETFARAVSAHAALYQGGLLIAHASLLFCTGNRVSVGFHAGDISLCSFLLGQAFHQQRKPPFSWFARVMAWMQAIAYALCQGVEMVSRKQFLEWQGRINRQKQYQSIFKSNFV